MLASARCLVRTKLPVALCALVFATTSGLARTVPAPAPYRVITKDTATEEMRGALTSRFDAGPQDVRVPKAAWLQIKFGKYNLGRSGTLTIQAIIQPGLANLHAKTTEGLGRFECHVQVDPPSNFDQVQC